jgi:hypothetical protein
MKEEWRINEERRREEEEKQELMRLEMERKEKEREYFKDLLNQANRWKQAKMLRRYIRKVKKVAIKNDNLTDDLKKWIRWAKQKADWYDPFINKEDDLLNDTDKQILI